MRTTIRSFLTLLLLAFGGGTALSAQARNDRIAQAFEEFDPARQAELLRGALNPAEGPADSMWFRGVQLLAQILIEQGREAEASVWLRWAFRLAPNASIDSVNFLPDVVRAAVAARSAAAAGSPGEAVARVSWQWSAPGAGEGRGMLRVESPAMSRPVRAFIAGVGTTESGRTMIVAPGTYEIQAAAEGYLATQLRREVLPGVTTILTFNLNPVQPVAPPVVQQPVTPPRAEPPAAAPAVLSADARAAVNRQIVPITVQRFGAPPSCVTGAFVGREGLVLTTYAGIRGAEAVELEMTGGRRVSAEVRVAGYDAAANVAVLQIPTLRSEVLALSDAAPAQPVWAFGFPDCRAPEDVRIVVSGRTGDQLQLVDSLKEGSNPGPLVSAIGAIVGLSTGGRRAVVGARLQQVLDVARRNTAAGQVLTVGQAALRENHAFGSVAISSDIAGATARITPLETWHWSELGRSGPLPLTFAGAMGRYRLEVLAGGTVQRQLEFTVRPATADRLAVTAEPIAARPAPGAPAQPQVQRRGGGGGAGVILAILGIGAGGAAACLLALCKGGDEEPGPTPTTDPGSIVISVPNPSIIFRFLSR